MMDISLFRKKAGTAFVIWVCCLLMSVVGTAQITVDEGGVKNVEAGNDGEIPVTVEANACAANDNSPTESCILKLVAVEGVDEDCDLPEIAFSIEEGETFSHLFNGLCPGTYSVVVENKFFDCEYVGATIKINDCGIDNTMEITYDLTSAGCEGGGAAAVSVSGGANPYTISLMGTTNQVITDKEGSHTFINLEPGAYTLEVEDDCGKKEIETFTLGGQVVEDLEVSVVAKGSCQNTSKGEAIINITEGLEPYTITLVELGQVIEDSGSSFTFSDLDPGNYTVEVEDKCGEVVSESFEIVRTVEIVYSEIQAPFCGLLSNNKIKLSIIGIGDEGFTVQWADTDNPVEEVLIQPNGTAQYERSNISFGFYSVTITDNQTGCKSTASFDVKASSPPVVPVVSDQSNTLIDCEAPYDDGKITFDLKRIDGEVVSFKWDDTNNPSDSYDPVTMLYTRTNLKKGNYRLIITYRITLENGNTCSKSVIKRFTIEDDLPTVSDKSAQLYFCNNSGSGRKGTIRFSVGGENAENYEFQWSDIGNSDAGFDPLNKIFIRTNLSDGDYKVTITNPDNQCFIVEEFEFQRVEEITLSNVMVVDNYCDLYSDDGDGNGGIHFTVLGPDSDYDIVLKDENGSEIEFGWDFWGYDPITRRYEGSLLEGGNYTVTVSNQDGCSITKEFTVQDKDEPEEVQTLEIKAASCNQNDGSISFRMLDGFGNKRYELEWEDTDNPIYSNYNDGLGANGTFTRTNLTPGIYVVHYTASIPTATLPCSGSATFRVPEIIPNISDIYTPPICRIDNDGIVQFKVKGAGGNYTFKWSDTNEAVENFDETSGKYTREGLAVGVHTVTVTAGNGCQTIEKITIRDIPSIAYVSSNNSNAIQLEFPGGVDSAPYTVAWEGGSNQISGEFSGITNTSFKIDPLTEGSYTIVVTNGKGCEQSFEVEVCADELNIELEPVVNIVHSENPPPFFGKIGVNITTDVGGQHDFTYSWTGPNGYTSETRIAYNLPYYGEYCVTVKDNEGCTTRTECYNILIPDDYDFNLNWHKRDVCTENRILGNVDGELDLGKFCVSSNLIDETFTLDWGHGVEDRITKFKLKNCLSGCCEFDIISGKDQIDIPHTVVASKGSYNITVTVRASNGQLVYSENILFVKDDGYPGVSDPSTLSYLYSNPGGIFDPPVTAITGCQFKKICPTSFEGTGRFTYKPNNPYNPCKGGGTVNCDGDTFVIPSNDNAIELFTDQGYGDDEPCKVFKGSCFFPADVSPLGEPTHVYNVEKLKGKDCSDGGGISVSVTIEPVELDCEDANQINTFLEELEDKYNIFIEDINLFCSTNDCKVFSIAPNNSCQYELACLETGEVLATGLEQWEYCFQNNTESCEVIRKCSMTQVEEVVFSTIEMDEEKCRELHWDVNNGNYTFGGDNIPVNRFCSDGQAIVCNEDRLANVTIGKNVTFSNCVGCDVVVDKLNPTGDDDNFLLSNRLQRSEDEIDLIRDMQVSKFGELSLLITGEYEDYATTNEYGREVLVAKILDNGLTAWVKEFEGLGNDRANQLAEDEDGNVLITGLFEQKIQFGDNTLQAEGSEGFIAKLNQTGEPVWSKKIGSSGADEGLDVATDQSNNIYTTGYITGPATFDGITTTNTAGVQSMFLAKYDEAGAVQWVKTGEQERGAAFEESMLTVDGSGNVYVAGNMSERMKFQGLANPVSEGSQGNGAFLTKYKPDGRIEWAERIGSSQGMKVKAITVDAQDHVMVAGQFTGLGRFGSSNLASNGGDDIFFARYAPDGTTVYLEQEGDANDNYISDLTTDGEGKFIYVGQTVDSEGNASCVIKEFDCESFHVSIDVTPVNCGVSNSGSIDLTVTGNEDPVIFEWSTGASSEDLTDLPTGVYGVSVSSSLGCTEEYTLVLNEVEELSLSASPNNATCGVNNGYVLLEVEGGQAPYTYRWSSGHHVRNLLGQGAGTYSVTVTDALGCMAETSASIGMEVHTVSATITASTCDRSDGRISLNVSPSGNYEYEWSKKTYSLNAGGYVAITEKDLTYVQPGTYTVTVTNTEDDCSVVKSFAVPSGGSMSMSAEVTRHLDCEDTYSGMIHVTLTDTESSSEVSNPSITITNLEDGSESNISRTSWTFSNLAAGLYAIEGYGESSGSHLGCSRYDTLRVEVSDLGRVSTVTQSGISFSSELRIGISSEHTLCNQANGAIDVTLYVKSSTGGTYYHDDDPHTTYAWSNGASTQDVLNLAAGKYTVTITRRDCEAIRDVVIEPSKALTAVANSIDASCFSCADGGVQLSVYDGNGLFAYSWSNGATTKDIAGVLPGTYTVTITDVGGCSLEQSVTVGYVSDCVLDYTLSTNAVSNYGGNDGTATIENIGGTAPHTYEWSTGGTETSINGLPAGFYDVTVTDNKGCRGIQRFEIVQPDCDMHITVNQTHEVTAAGNNSDGALKAVVAGGVAPFKYRWSNGRETAEIAGLTAGTYIVSVTDALGCKREQIKTISACTFDVDVAMVASDCKKGGSLTAVPLGGTPPYIYHWQEPYGHGYFYTLDIAGPTLNRRSGLYKLIVTDAAGCQSIGTYTIEDNGYDLSGFISEEENCGRPPCVNAELTIEITNGQGGLMYEWSTGETTPSITAGWGLYSVRVEDSNGCSNTFFYERQSPDVDACSEFSVELQPTGISCSGEGDGSIRAVVGGADDVSINGEPVYTYEWSTGERGASIHNLSPGTYSVTVTSGSFDCQTSASITIGEGANLVLSPYSKDVSQPGQSDGEASVTVSGGTPPYQYEWDNSAKGITSSISGLSAGVYTVVVTDANGCSSSVSIAVNQPTCALNVSLSGIAPSCKGYANGSVRVEVSGGSGNYEYEWAGMEETSSVVNGLKAGTYTVTVSEGICSNTASITLVNPEELGVVVHHQDVRTVNGSEGSATAFPYGGTPDYSYLWSINGRTEQRVENLTAGEYSVLVRDDNGCEVIGNVTIDGLDCSGFTVGVSSSSPSCHGSEDGSISVVLPADDEGTYTFAWSGTNSTSQSVNDLGKGTYIVTVTNEQGCTTTEEILLSEPDELVIEFTVNSHVTQIGGEDASVTASVRGGTLTAEQPSYTYLWSDGSTEATISNKSKGTYSLTVIDANNCQATASVSLFEPNCILYSPMSLAFSTTDVSCFEGSDGSVRVSVENAETPYTYLWSNGQTTSGITGLTKGSYSVEVTDGRNCTISESVTIGEPEKLVVNLSKTDASFEDSNGRIMVNTTGGVSPYTYYWSHLGGDGSSNEGGLSPGNYTVDVTDQNGCSVSASIEIQELNPSCDLEVSVNVLQNETGFDYNDGRLQAVATNANGQPSFDWGIHGNGASVSGLSPGTYTVTVTDLPYDNCVVTASATVEEFVCDLSVSGNVTPSSCTSLGSVLLEVRSSQSNNISFLWDDGTTSGNRSNLEPGTYSVTVTDEFECHVVTSITVEGERPLERNFLQVSPYICENLQGSARIEIIGGIPPYSYEWSNGESGPSVSNLMVGTHSVSVSDQQGCVIEEVINIHKLGEDLSATISCNGFNMFSTVVGGALPYTYQWQYTLDINNGNWFDAGTSSSIRVGKGGEYYRLIVTDANGCTATSNVVFNSDENCTVDPVNDSELESRILDRSMNESPKINIYPNPFQQTLNIDLASPLAQEVTIMIYDLVGRMIYERVLAIETGKTTHTVDLTAQGYANGIYHVVVVDENGKSQFFKVVQVE